MASLLDKLIIATKVIYVCEDTQCRCLILLHINALFQCLRDTFHHLVELREKLNVTYVIAAGWNRVCV